MIPNTRAAMADRIRIATALDILATREVPPIRAAVAANWTLTAPPAPDELIDVWCAVDDWLSSGAQTRVADPSDATNPYIRVVHCLTRFDDFLRGSVR